MWARLPTLNGIPLSPLSQYLLDTPISDLLLLKADPLCGRGGAAIALFKKEFLLAFNPRPDPLSLEPFMAKARR